MTRQMKKAVYEVPITECFQVELEGIFCGSINMGDQTNNGNGINDQDVNTGFDTAVNNNGGFVGGAWD